MSKTCKFIVFVFCIAITASACDFFQEKKVPRKTRAKVSQVQQQEIIPPVIRDERPVTCVDVLKQKKEIQIKQWRKDQKVVVDLDSNKIIDETSLIQWLSQFTAELFDEESCPIKVISFSTHIDEYTYFQGKLTKIDYLFYKQKRISQPEWVKRFEIKKMETQQALNIELKKMRDLKDLGSALKIVTKILSDDINNQEAKLIKGNIHLDMKACSEALNAYDDVLASQPDNVRALFNYAFANKEMGSFAQAIEKTKKVRDLITHKEKGAKYLAQLDFPVDTVLLQLAEVYLKNNETALAAATLKDIKSKSAVAYVLLKAQLHRLTQKHEKAKNELMTVVDSGDWQDVVLFNIVLLHLDLKDKDGAKQYYDMLKDVNIKMAQELSLVNNLPLVQEESEPSTDVVGGNE